MILGGKPSDRSEPSQKRGRVGLLLRTAALLTISVALGATFLAGAWTHRAGVIGDARDWVRERSNADYWRSYVDTPRLPTLTFDMGFKNLQKVEAKRAEALDLGLLFASDDDFVPAELRFDGATIPIKMRLKGDWTDHLKTDKWSFRIHVKDDEQVMGLRRFSIQHPGTRNYIKEWGILENLRYEGIVAPRYQFINVVFNGDAKGIYALEEFFAKEMIESQGRREGIFLALDEDLFWKRQGQASALSLSPRALRYLRFEDTLARAYGASRIDRDPGLASQRLEALRLLRGYQQGTLTASEVFDVPLLGRYLALIELWSASHGIAWFNSIFYYNPLTTKLEPVGFDNLPGREPNDVLLTPQRAMFQQALEDPKVATAYVSELERVSSEEYLSELRAAIGQSLEANLKALRIEWPRLESPWDELRQRQRFLRAALKPPRLVQALQVPVGLDSEVSSRSDGQIQVEVANIFDLSTEVVGIRHGSGEFIPAADLLASDVPGVHITQERSVILSAKDRDGPPAFIDLNVPVTDQAVPALREESRSSVVVLNRLPGSTYMFETPVTAYPPISSRAAIPKPPTTDEALTLHPALELTGDPSMLRLRPGEWNFEQDLVLPDEVGLEIGPGTTLRFAPGTVLLSRGALRFVGTEDAPVVLGPSDGSWSGIVALSAPSPSFWEHVVVENTDGVARGGWILTGGITFYESPITLVNTRILRSSAEDAINIVRASFAFYDTEVSNTASDALDADFARGTIVRSGFHDIRGDAIDLSGSVVTLGDVHVINVVDKGLSAGESTRVTGDGFDARNVGIGIASKDLSQVSLSETNIENWVYAAMAAYTKKAEYGTASIEADQVTMRGNGNRFLIQTGSWIRLDGEYFRGTDLDVGALYDASVTGQLPQSRNP